MEKINLLKLLMFSLFGLSSSHVLAHTPLCSCSDLGDGEIECEGGFSDGSSARGVKMLVMDASGKVIHEGKMDANNLFTFKKPSGQYSVKFDAGEGHRITIPSSKIN